MVASIVAEVLLKTSDFARGTAQVKSQTSRMVSDVNGSLHNAQARFAAAGDSAGGGFIGRMKQKMGGAGDIMKGVLGANVVVKGAELATEALGKIPEEIGRCRDAASSLQQSSGAVAAVFKSHTAEMTKQADGAAQALGLSKNSYQELATVLGAGLKNQGLKDFAGQTQNVIKLGADLSAQYGGSTKDAVEAVTSLMRGETDPIERYGVSINQTAIAAELAARGQDKLKGKALQQASAQARLALLFRQTKDAQGAFGRESGTLENVQQRNAAAVENLRAKLGTSLLPVFTAGATLVSEKVLPALDKLVDWAQSNLPGALQAAQAALGPVMTAIGGFASQLGGLFSGGQMSGLVAQLQPLGAAIGSVLSAVGGVLQTILPIVGQVFGAIVSGVQTAMPALQTAYTAIASVLGSLGSILTSVWSAIGPIILPIITTVFGTAIKVIGGAFTIISGLFSTIAAVLRGDWSGAWNGIKQITSGAWAVIKAVIGGALSLIKTLIGGALGVIKGLFSGAWNGIKAATSATWNAIKGAVTGAWNGIKAAVVNGTLAIAAKIRELPGRARSALGNIGGALKSAGQQLVRGFIDGIGSALSWVADKARSIAKTAISAAKAALGIHSPSKVFKQIGAYVGAGFVDGLKGSESQAKAAVSKMVGLLTKEAKTKGASAGRARAALKIVNRLDGQAISIAKQRAAATAALSEQQKTLNDLVQQQATYITQVSDAAKAYADITGYAAADGLPQTASNLVDELTARLGAITDFKDKIAALKARGVNADTIDQIVSAGVDKGADTLNALYNADSATIKQINQLQASVNTTADQLGKIAGTSLYGAGIAAQKGLVAGLLADKQALDAAATQIAKTLSTAVKKALKIKSPSQVFAGIGGQVTDGLIIGLAPDTVERAGRAMATSLTDGFGDPTLRAAAQGGRGSGTVVQQITVEVHADATTDQVSLGRALTKSLKAYKDAGGKLVAA